MAQQPSREFTSTDPTTRTQDAGFQESGFSPKISLNPRSRLQHFQRPTPSHLRKKRTEPSGPRRCRRGATSSLRREPNMPADLLRALFGNVTVPSHPPNYRAQSRSRPGWGAYPHGNCRGKTCSSSVRRPGRSAAQEFTRVAGGLHHQYVRIGFPTGTTHRCGIIWRAA